VRGRASLSTPGCLNLPVGPVFVKVVSRLLMSIFNKPASQVTEADLAQLSQDGAVESIRLEFKSNVPDKDETLKKLSSFANTFGGMMIVGAKANSTDGRLQDLPGVDEQAGYKQKVIQWCFDSTSPPLNVAVSDAIPAPGGQGKVCYVVQADQSDVAPHFVNGRKGVWVRSDEFSQRYEPILAQENEIRHLLDRRKLVNERRSALLVRSQRRFETLLSRPAEPGGEISSRPTVGPLLPRVQICFGPRFPARPVCGQEELGKMIQALHVSWRQTTFPSVNSRCISQHESMLRITPEDAANRKGMIEANIWGLIYYGTQLEIEIGPKQTDGQHQNSTSGIHLYRFLGYILVCAEHAKRMIKHLAYEGPLTVNVAIDGILGIPWLYSDNGFGIFRRPASELDDGFSLSLPATTDRLIHQRDALVADVLQQSLFGMNWADMAGASSLEKLLRSGYEYNFWGKSATLQM
jgi:hypothetical protein